MFPSKATSLISDDGVRLDRSASDLSLPSSDIDLTEDQVLELPAIDASKAAFSATGKVLRAIVNRPDFEFVVNDQGSTALHCVGSIENAWTLLDKADVSVMKVKNKDQDTPIGAVFKRAANFKKDTNFVDFIMAMIQKCPEALGM